MIARAERLLRGEGEFATGSAQRPWIELAGLVAIFAALHGAAVGSSTLRAEQALYSALKLPILIAGATAMCVPSFYALNAVLGLRDDFGAALRGVLGAQATVAVTLAALAPLVLLAYLSGTSYRGAILVNGLVFCVASLAGQVTLSRQYRPLIARNRRHALTKAAWLALTWFVTIQLAWVLRPFVGDPALDPTFLRPHAWSNAYVALARAVLGR
jgi:hypothetical protein